MVYLWVVDGGDGLQVLQVAADVLNKPTRCGPGPPAWGLVEG